MFVVFDLDGTLALNGHRQHLIDCEPKRWDDWHFACAQDEPNWPAIKALFAHMQAGHRVEIWSGRSDMVIGETHRWLSRHGIPSSRLARMRPAGDHCPDVDLKRKWLMRARESGLGAPDVVYDDRDRVVAMWREEGVPCFQVAPGPF